VTLSARNADGSLPAVEVRVVPEGAMIAFVASRLGEARSALDRSSAERDRARRDAEVALAETDRTDQEWKATTANDLHRRIEVLLRRPKDPAEVAAVHAELLARKKASYKRAVQAARRSNDKERAFVEIEQEARRYRDARFFVRGLPPAVGSARTAGSGDFAMDLAPGRYALVALPEADPADVPFAEGWLLWVVVGGGAPEPIVLDGSNRHGTDCDACVVSTKELP
jgi:hypothetical protein